LNFLTALTSVVGVLVALLMASYVEGLTEILIPFAAGGFIYIAIADLIPELHKEVAVSRSILQFLFGALGVALMVGMMFLPFHTHEHDEANGASLHEHEYEVILSE